MDNPEIILTPNGDAIVLKTISYVSAVIDNSGHDNIKWDSCYFTVHFGPKPTEYAFSYYYNQYSDDKKTLFAKVQNIRKELLKMLNDGMDAKEINGGINLKKNDK